MSLYATLLLPFQESRPGVQPVIRQMLSSGDKRLKYQTLILLMRNNKIFPDTLLNYYAAQDEYRYELYTDLNDLDKKDKFPLQYNNQPDISKSKLIGLRSYRAPDSLVFIDKLPATIKTWKGFIYFYKYKNKKDDMTWKLATTGLFPEDSTSMEFEETEKDQPVYSPGDDVFSNQLKLDFTHFSTTRLRQDQPLEEQLQRELRRILYSRRNSAKEFYEKNKSENYEEVINLE